jgi:glycosyltransferase involved in cell wall biosynthesis
MMHGGISIYRIHSFGSHRGSTFGRVLFGASFMVGAAFHALLKANAYDGLVVATNPPFLGLAAVLVRWLRRKPYVMIGYDIYPETAVGAGLLGVNSVATRIWAWVSRLIFSNSAMNIVIGRDMEQVIARKCGNRPCAGSALITNWSDLRRVFPVAAEQNAFRKQHNPRGLFVVQYSGMMARIHNVEPLLEAAEILNRDPVLFQFIGDGFKKSKMQQEAQRRGLTNVHFLPFQPEDNLAQVLSAADLAVVCLAREFTGLSVPSKAYGIMAAGVPILAMMEPHSEIGLTVKESDCGIVISIASGDQVAAAIRTLVADPERARVMGRNGYLAFKSRFTLDIAAAQYDKVFREAFLGGALDGAERRRRAREPEKQVAEALLK